jgi:bifunctional UDP-N-acetylglucosamine pyrophosphorylase/glucosamine-1-phosphate N-acetyltransferase
VNDKEALAQLEELARQKINSDWMKAGVRLVDPKCTYIDAQVRLSPDVELGPGVVLKGRTQIGEGAKIGAYSQLQDCIVAAGATVLPLSVAEGASIGESAQVGPFARLRQGAVLEEQSKVGNFVEVKKTRLGPGSKANHLAYLGDATIGKNANIGAGTITCNYDGHNKHPTDIGSGAFIGSNSSLVAPVKIGDGAIVGAGSTINQNVPSNALGIARAKQANVPDLASLIHAKNRQDQDSET